MSFFPDNNGLMTTAVTVLGYCRVDNFRGRMTREPFSSLAKFACMRRSYLRSYLSYSRRGGGVGVVTTLNLPRTVSARWLWYVVFVNASSTVQVQWNWRERSFHSWSLPQQPPLEVSSSKSRCRTWTVIALVVVLCQNQIVPRPVRNCSFFCAIAGELSRKLLIRCWR